MKKTTFKLIEKTDCRVSMGHLELAGFAVSINMSSWSMVLIANYLRSSRRFSAVTITLDQMMEECSYLGNPYEIYWNDVEDPRGFHIFDTDTLELTPINNPYRLFYKLYYDDEPSSLLDARPYKDKIVKLIVRNKPRPKEFEKVVDKLYSAGVSDLKIIENFDFHESAEFEAFETEDTLSILNRYVEESDVDLDRNKIKIIMEADLQRSM